MFLVSGPDDDVPFLGTLSSTSLSKDATERQEHLLMDAWLLTLPRDALACISKPEDIKLRYEPMLIAGSEPNGPNRTMFDLVMPILAFYASHHKGPSAPHAFQYLGISHMTSLTITVSHTKK